MHFRQFTARPQADKQGAKIIGHSLPLARKHRYNRQLGDLGPRQAAQLLMVVTGQSSDGSQVRIVARGNFSLDAGGLASLLLALAVVTIGLAAVLAWQGYWPVLLIAVLQIVLVVWVLVRAWERCWVAEWIEVGPDHIEVTHQRHKASRQSVLQTAWAVVEMRRPRVAWYGPHVVLRSRSQVLELGRFLTQDERGQLARDLREAIGKHSALNGARNG